ncbi:hypothetical protein J4Q44_G00346340 [Coregonus suidteri]|uniref:Glyoxalase/fosfomycin resistance/dioxygenase domain-containing protein n=1 Tax=Coregonus suidteri TaxID=861788 RepID=A0AAN8KQ55_9TELE
MTDKGLTDEAVSAACKEGDPITQDYILQQTMLRVKDPLKSLDFYTRIMGMTLLQKIDFPSMCFTLYFLESDSELEEEDEIDPQPAQDQPISSQPQDQPVSSQPQDQPVSSQPQDQPVSSLQEKYGCQKIVKLNGLLAQGMSHPSKLPM